MSYEMERYTRPESGKGKVCQAIQEEEDGIGYRINQRRKNINPLKTKIMARVKLPAGIESISGRVGGVCFRTMKASGRVYMYPINVQRGANGQNKGTKMPNVEEKARRERFAKRAGMVRYMRAAGSELSAKELWKITAQVL